MSEKGNPKVPVTLPELTDDEVVKYGEIAREAGDGTLRAAKEAGVELHPYVRELVGRLANNPDLRDIARVKGVVGENVQKIPAKRRWRAR